MLAWVMSVSIDEFWKLAIESRLLTIDQSGKLELEFGHVKGAARQGNARTLSEWLIANNLLTRYQTTLLLAGSPGPFYYGEYKVVDRIKEGGRAGWFRAVHLQTGHPVQLQFVSGPAAENPSVWSSVSQRARSHCDIIHPHLSRCFEVVDLGSHKFIVHDDPPGQAVAELLASSGAAPPQEAARMIRLAALGLAHLHSTGAVAGQIDPSLLWLEPTGNMRILLNPLLTPTPMAKWTPGEFVQRIDYSAPELGQPGRLPDALCDIYALGCNFYQLLSGQVPFEGGDPAHKVARHATEPARPLEQMGVPLPIAQVATYMMAKNQSVRYQDVGQAAEQLAGMIDSNQLNLPPSEAPSSLDSYQQWIAQKQAALSVGPTAPTGNRSPTGNQPADAAGPMNPVDVSSRPMPGSSPKTSFSVSTDSTGSLADNRASSQGRQPSIQNMVIGAGILGVLLIVGGLIAFPPGRTDNNEPEEREVETNVVDTDPNWRPEVFEAPTFEHFSPGTQTDVENASDRQEIVDDDGELLWASPTMGNKINLRLTPPGAQLFLIARPQEMLATQSGELVFEALGPDMAAAQLEWERAAGISLREVDQLIVAFYPVSGRPPRVAVVVRFDEPQPNLVAKWTGAQIDSEAGQQFYTKGEWSYYIDPEGDNRAFVMGATEEVRRAVESRGAAPTLRREIGSLLAHTDRDYHFTMLVAPNFLMADGRKLFENSYREKMLAPIRWFLGDDLKGAMVGMYFGDEQFYLETRFLGNTDKTLQERTDYYRERLAEIPHQVERFIAVQNLHQHARMLLTRYPQMMYWIQQNARFGIDEMETVINLSGESRIAHNLVSATELALVSSSSSPVSTQPPLQNVPQNNEEVVAKKISMAFPQTSLEFAMRDLADLVKSSQRNLPFEFRIRILGNDLQLEGITRNQQVVDFEATDKTVAEILTSLVMKANPVTTVQSPSEVDQKLLWVIGPDPEDPTKEIILITTRSSAATKGYTLPAVFQTDQ